MEKHRKRLRIARSKLDVILAQLTKRRKARDQAVARLHALDDEIMDIHDRLNIIRDRIDEAHKQKPVNEVRVRELNQELGREKSRLVRVKLRVESRRAQKDRAITKAHVLIENRKWRVKQMTTLRKKIQRAKQKQHPEFEPWMANGYDYNVTQGVKDFIARGVVQYGLVCTSLRRTYVPPGGSSTSYHLQTPGRAGDIAGSRMQEFQISEYNRLKGNGACLEMFGPSNVHNLKYGNHLSMAEGTGLENLHDTHVHAAF